MNSTVSPLFTFSNTTDITEQTMSAEDYEEYQEVHRLFMVGMGINKYYLWTLFALGFPGNIASIITIFRMKSIGTFPVFVVMLAVTHSLAILVKLLFYQLMAHGAMNSAGCCLLRFLGSWSSAYSSWILVCMALERFVAVCFPLRTTIYNGSNATKILTAKILGVVGFLVALIYMPLLWTNEVSHQGSLQCQYKQQYAHFMDTVYFWVLATVYAFVPFCLLTVFNCLIASQVRASFQSRVVVRNVPLMPSHQNGAADAEGPVQRQQRPHRNFHAIQAQINLMLLSAIVVFIVLTFPICIFMLVDPHWKVTPGYTRSNAIKYLCQQVAFVLVDSTHAVNFYLYFLSARRFRHHFLRLVTCKFCAAVSRPSVGMPRAVTTVTWKICSSAE